MYPRSFEYVAAESIDEAVSALSSSEFGKVMSGGMSLIPMMKLRLLSPDTVIDIGGVSGLDQITEHDDHTSIGGLVPHKDTAESDLVPQALKQAASWTGDPQVRNRGTTCGAIAHADLAADQTAAILALGATMVVQGPSGTREVAADDWFVDTMMSALEPDEILTEIKIPKRAGGTAYDKLGRRGGHTDYAVAGVAAWVARDNGTISDCRLAVTGVGSKPTLASEAADALIGTDGSESVLADAASRASAEVSALEDLYGSEEYKTHLTGVFVKRAVSQALGAQ
ncbi:MAG: xanthine dehydrogenase family protein subunit M [Acidimicrobiia bacterium]|nr:xanthine dehydrogenase family protein subunit M [Acidimicrobiia bacterium]